MKLNPHLINLLKKLFPDFNQETLQKIFESGKQQLLKSGEYLFRQGEDDGQAFYILEGTAVLERAENDNENAVRTCASGEFIGGLILLGKHRRLFSLRADAETNCLILSREKFTKTIEQFPELMPKLLKAVVSGIGNWEERFLSDRAEKCGDCMANLGVSLI